MKKYSDYSIIADLLVRSLEEGLTSEEEEKLAQWRKENDRHEALYKRLHSSSFWESHPQRKYRHHAYLRGKLKKIAVKMRKDSGNLGKDVL